MVDESDFEDILPDDQQEEESDLHLRETSFRDVVVQTVDWTMGTMYAQLERRTIDLDPSFQRRQAWDDARNWSSVVQIKQEHELIEDGPYRYVRHPIYTGLLLAFMGTALRVGDVRGILAVLIVILSFWRKYRVEERLLEATFGDAYRRYRDRTAALIPGVF